MSPSNVGVEITSAAAGLEDPRSPSPLSTYTPLQKHLFHTCLTPPLVSTLQTHTLCHIDTNLSLTFHRPSHMLHPQHTDTYLHRYTHIHTNIYPPNRHTIMLTDTLTPLTSIHHTCTHTQRHIHVSYILPHSYTHTFPHKHIPTSLPYKHLYLHPSYIQTLHIHTHKRHTCSHIPHLNT